MKRKACMIITLLCAAMLLAGCGAETQPRPDALLEAEYIALVGECEVPLEEYRLFAQDSIATVAGEYARGFDADPNATDFWTTEYDGQRPIDELKRQANERMARQKGAQLLAQRYGILADAGFGAFTAELEEENALRQSRLDGGEVVFGPQQYAAGQYYSYRQSQIEFALLEYVEQNLVSPTGAELAAYYDQIKDDEDHKNFTAEVAYFSWPSTGDDARVAALLQAKSAEGMPAEQCAEALAGAGVAVTVRQRAISTHEMGKEDTAYQQVVSVVWGLNTGDWSELLAGSENAAVIWVQSKAWEAFGSYEENAAYVEALYREDRAKALIDAETAAFPIQYTTAYANLAYQDIS